jgi:hypothetical protein
LVAVLLVLAGCVPPGGPGSPKTTVTPANNLVDGQLVRVNGTGFPANTDVVVVQCSTDPPTPDNCDLGGVQFLVTDSNGNVSSQYFVARKLFVGSGEEFDCASTACVMAVSDLDVLTFDSAPITFNPSAPLAKPLVFGVSLANNGKVLESNGVAALFGTMICNRGAFIEIDGRLSQAFGRFLFRSDFTVVKSCPSAGAVDIGFFVEPDNGLFAAGPATVRFSAFGIAGTTVFTQDETSHAVNLTALPETTAARAATESAVAAHTAPAGVAAHMQHRSPQSGTHW